MNKEIIKDLFKEIEKYEAHIKTNAENKIIEREKLLEHLCTTAEYFDFIREQKGMPEIQKRFLAQVYPKLSNEAEDFVEDMVTGLPFFHDVGKINPIFQYKKMQNENFRGLRQFACIGSRHSLLSSIIYMDYYMEKLKKAVKSKEEKQFLRILVVYHAYVIARHHGDLGGFYEFLGTLENGIGMSILKDLQNNPCAYQGAISLTERIITKTTEKIEVLNQNASIEESIAWYTYVKLLYSVLVAADYYATASFMQGMRISQLGNLDKIEKWMEAYESTELMQRIRTYQTEKYPQDSHRLCAEKNISVLRTEMFIETELELQKNQDKNLFYMEAPTGIGKSNTAINLSFQLIRADKRLKKIYYIYPFNTLVEQNVRCLQKIFGSHEDIYENIAVINSLTPIKMTEKEKEEAEEELGLYYGRALLDRQFLNYPMIVSTHVSLFDTLFGSTKESAFGFHQLMNSVVVLDEIQNYKNKLWGEIIRFFKEISYLLHIKLIIMSATLPDFDLLSDDTYPAVKLVRDREEYFLHPCFKERVQISFELMNAPNIEEKLVQHVKKSSLKKKKILMEFITKDSAERFFRRLKADKDISCDVEYMSGDDSLMERRRILEKVDSAKGGIILVATQVVEAGVDIDMDIGYKNISKLDSEEQFMGRINRSCSSGKNGVVYFFKIDDYKKVYSKDLRAEREYTLETPKMREVLIDKNYPSYYEQILTNVKNIYNRKTGEEGLSDFFKERVGKLDYPKVSSRMQLIEEDKWTMSVFLSRVLHDENGEEIGGQEIWRTYGMLLEDYEMDYSEKQVKLSRVKSLMTYFIYQIEKNLNLTYDDKIGEIIYIRDGEKYFDNGKLNRPKVQGEIGKFVEFI
ncbi:MAG: CRISPR-associated helicase Cas3' [Eubacteriales bacterium]|nr:CRISPR-associated helicase Cas3' [Eubacteriales bacterium]